MLVSPLSLSVPLLRSALTLAAAPLVSDLAPSSPEKPFVVAVHGFWNSRGVWLPLRERCSVSGYGFAAVDLLPPWADVETFSSLCASTLKRVLDETSSPVVLVGHSMGGLVARRAMEIVGGERFAGYVSVASPHAGTPMARLGLGFAAPSMLPDSDWLNRLPPPSARSLCVRAVRDRVVPPASQVPEWADESVDVDCGHNSVLASDDMLSVVSSFLSWKAHSTS